MGHPVAVAQADDGMDVAPRSVEVPGPDDYEPNPGKAVVRELAKPFPKKYIHDDGRKNDYVPHHVVNQRLIQIFGAPPRISIVREIYDVDKLRGVLMRLEAGGYCVEEFGEADNPQSKTNGARSKDAASDAIKRCAMRLGLGLHLWAGDDYFLFDVLTRDAK